MTGVILTGGKSSRMGQDKALLTVGGVQLIRRIIDVYEKLFDEILVVTNKAGRHEGPGYREVTDIIPECGPLGGIYTGLSYAKYDRIFVASCDLPFIMDSTVRIVISEPVSYDIVVPDDGLRLHPLHAVYSRKCVPQMRKWLDNGLYNVTKFINEVEGLSVRKIQMSEITAGDQDFKSFFNMNTQEDLAAANTVADKEKLK
ncbi:MAG: molybdenum cofactor guanylyltransferase [Nitrospirae bacterium]|nr:molybdenum cofactor guanylyltransferase [Nitrospirota bacterium]